MTILSFPGGFSAALVDIAGAVARHDGSNLTGAARARLSFPRLPQLRPHGARPCWTTCAFPHWTS